MPQTNTIHVNKLKAVGAGALVMTLAGVPALESISLAANAVGFIEQLPDVESDPLLTEPINYGTMGEPAAKGQSWHRVLFGDSLTWGYNTDGKQYCVAQMVASDVNRMLQITGVPPLPDNRPYWQNYMWAEPGTKAAQMSKQIEAFASLMHEYPKAMGPWTVEASMGGVDALRYLMDHLNWKRGRYTVSDFQKDFLPAFKVSCLQNIQGLMNLRSVPALADIRFIEINGIPNIGESKDLWVMEIPGVKAIATAAVAYMNEGLVEVIRKIKAETGFPIFMHDMFGLAMSDIHPSPSGYFTAADRREQRLRGTFPDGNRSFKDERLNHGLELLESASLSTMAPSPGAMVTKVTQAAAITV